MMTHSDTVIVGGGLAGLACARRLEEAGRDYVLLEGADAVGGRVRTDVVEGFRLDRGFQVLLQNYPEARRVLDFDALDLKRFASGALVRFDGSFHRLTDPWTSPFKSVLSVANPIGSLRDKLRVQRLRARSVQYLSDPSRAPEGTALEALRGMGFSASMIDRFFRPFLGGVFLDDTLNVPARMLYFVFGHFARGGAAIPSVGMQAIPDQLADGLDPERVRTGLRVNKVDGGRVLTESGEGFEGNHIVSATNASPDDEGWRAVTCLYFVAEKDPFGEPILVLNGDGEGPINNLCVPTSVAPEYGPGDASLVSVTVLGVGDDETTQAVGRQLVSWFGPEAVRWRLLKSYYIPKALPPANAAPAFDPLVCGDRTVHASIEGALLSGRRSAEHILGA